MKILSPGIRVHRSLHLERCGCTTSNTRHGCPLTNLLGSTQDNAKWRRVVDEAYVRAPQQTYDNGCTMAYGDYSKLHLANRFKIYDIFSSCIWSADTRMMTNSKRSVARAIVLTVWSTGMLRGTRRSNAR